MIGRPNCFLAGSVGCVVRRNDSSRGNGRKIGLLLSARRSWRGNVDANKLPRLRWSSDVAQRLQSCPDTDSLVTMTDASAEVWHYTTVQAAQSILETGEIYASHVGFLNDRTEGLHYGEVLVESLRGMRDRLDDSRQKARLDLLIESFHPKAPEVYVASFIGVHDRLDSWRAYANNGLGVALGFVRDLMTSEHASRFNFTKCDYVNPTEPSYRVDAEIWHNVMDGLTSSLADDLFETRDLPAFLFNLQESLRSFGPTIKHYAFAEEQEYRMVLDSHQVEPSAVEYRERYGYLVPFVRIKYPAKALAKVLLGPGLSDRSDHADTMRKYLQSIGRGDVKVETSRVPIRAA